MRIGITERGDAGRDLSWVQKLNTPTFDGAVLITKTITKDFAQAVLAQTKPIIIHATCTGYGGTEMEPCVFPYQVQLNAMKHLIEAGFPASRVVLRIDPIFPTSKGIAVAEQVLNYFDTMNVGVHRIRFSVVDQYSHVMNRFAKKGWPMVYPGRQPTQEQMAQVIGLIMRHQKEKRFFETCAEPELVALANQMGVGYMVDEVGCISTSDLFLMGFDGFSKQNFTINPQNRGGCKCLSCKTEMLTRKHPCENGCVYCYWKKGEER